MKTVLLLAKVLSAIFQQTLGGFPYFDKNSLYTNDIIWLIVIIFSSSFTYGSYEGSALEFGIESALCNPNKEELVYLTDSVENKEFKVVKENSLAPNELSGKSAMSLAYCYPNSTSPYGFYIKTVIFEDISNPDVQEDKKTDYNGSQGFISLGVRDYTSQFSTDVLAGSTYTLTGMAKLESANSHRYIWIDFNQNDIFESNEEVVNIVDSNVGSNTNFSHSIPIDANATPGLTRMRIMVSKDAITYPLCSATFEGEMEDYELNITGGGGGDNPEVVLSTAVLNVDGVFDVSVDFSEDVSQPQGPAFILSNNATAIIQPGSSIPNSYVLTVNPFNSMAGAIEITLPANSVTDSDGNPNNASNTIVFNYTPPTFTIDGLITNESQNNANDGAINISVINGTAPYNFNWSNNSGTEDISGLTAGTYTVTVIDANGGGVVESFVVVTNSSNNCSSPQDIPQIGNTTGISSIQSGSKENPVDGNASSSVKTDHHYGNDDFAWWEVEIHPESHAIHNIAATGTSSDKFNNFDIYLSNNPFPASGPSPSDLVMSWNTQINSRTVINFPEPFTTGKYLRIQKKVSGKLEIAEIEIFGCPVNTTPEELAVNLVSTNPTSPNGNDGSIEAVVTGGEGPYSYNWVGSSGTNSSLLENIGVGVYTLVVTDLIGNTVSSSSELVFNSDPLLLDFTVVNVSAVGASDGSIASNISGGIIPYSYIWDNGETSSAIQNLTSGIYFLTVIDNEEQEIEGFVDVGVGVNVLQLTASITNQNILSPPDGSITSVVTGGIPPYSYLWSNNSIEANLINIPGGIYSLTVTDAVSNQIIESFEVIFEGGNDCSTPINFALSGISNQVSDKKSYSGSEKAHDGLESPNHVFTSPYVCSSTKYNSDAYWEIDLEENKLIDEIQIFNTVSGNDLQNYYIFISQFPFTTNITEDLLNDHSVFNLFNSGLAQFPTSHSINVSGRYVRVQTQDYFVSLAEVKILGCEGGGIAGLDLVHTIVNPTGNSSEDGSIDITPLGGTPPYSFDWSHTSEDIEDVVGLNPGIYNLTITDADNNSITETFVLNSLELDIEGTFHELTKKLSGGFVYSPPNELYVKLKEDYNIATGDQISYKIISSNSEIQGDLNKIENVRSGNSNHFYGINFYKIDLTQFSLSYNFFYTLVVENVNKGEKYYLRFKNYCENCPSE